MSTTTLSLRPLTQPKPAPNRRRAIVRWAKRGLLGIAALAGVAAIVRAWLPKPVAVDVAEVSHQTLEVEVAEDGQTRVRERFVVSAPISGELARIEIEAGASVEPHQIVARILPPRSALLDPRSRKETIARLAAARAQERETATAIARAKAARDSAVREAERARRLARDGAITGAERDRDELAERLAIEDVAATELHRRAAAANVDALQATLDAASPIPTAGVDVPAPARGRVLRVTRESAGFVVAGTPLLEVGDPAAIEVVIDVLSTDATRLAPGMTVWIDAGGDRPLTGKVRLVEPSAFTRISALGVEEQRVRVIADVDAQLATLGDGYRVEARVITWRGDVVAIPSSALFRDRDAWAVYVVEDGRARLRRVTIGHRGRSEVELLGGVAAGSRVIAHPNDRISDGTRIEVRRGQP
jgi:HlyD family secretion protein